MSPGDPKMNPRPKKGPQGVQGDPKGVQGEPWKRTVAGRPQKIGIYIYIYIYIYMRVCSNYA